MEVYHMKRIAFLLRLMQTSLFLFVNAVPAQEQIDTSNKIEHSLLERMFGYDVAYEDFEQRQSLDNVNVLKRLPIIKHDMSEEIRQTII